MCYAAVCRGSKPTRLACLRRTASVHSEPGSNSSKRFIRFKADQSRKKFVTRDRVITSVEFFESLRSVIPKELGAMLRFEAKIALMSLYYAML